MNHSLLSMINRSKQTRLAGLVLSFCATLVISGCSDSQADVAAEKAYFHQAQSDVLKQQSHYQVSRKFVGKVESKQNANIGFEQTGKVALLYVDEGDLVKQGDILAQQDIELLKVDREELVARMGRTKADLVLAKANLKRIRALKRNAFSSVQTLEELEAREQGLLSTKRRIEAGLHSNQVKINKSTLYAPFNGVVSERFIALGEVIAAGTPALKMLQTGADEIKVGVPAYLLDQLNLDQVLTVTIAQQQHQVKLLTKGRDVDQVTRTVQLRFALVGKEVNKDVGKAANVINGQLAYLHFPQDYQSEGYWVPMTALTDGIRGMWNVYILSPQANSELFMLQSRNVQILYATEDTAYISGAVSDGERYLSAGLHRLVPGQQVKTSIAPAGIKANFAAGTQSTNSTQSATGAK